MAAVTRAGGLSTAIPERATRSSPELGANLRTVRAQMADWVTCPSAKTPQGKAKIAQISERLDSIQQQIKKSDTAPPSAPTPGQATRSAAAASAEETVDYLSTQSRVGLNVDTYA